MIFLSEGFRMLRRRILSAGRSLNRYEGNADMICRQIVEDCYNKEKSFFMASAGHFSQFYSRDFGLCVDSLKYLGYEDRARKSIKYALDRFEKHGSITTTITPGGTPFDFPRYSPDSLAFMTHSLVSVNSKDINNRYQEFIERESDRFFKIVIDESTGLVRKKHFGSMKDHAIRKSSCYDNVMVAWLSANLDLLGFENPLKNYDMKKSIKDNFWNGECFIDDLSEKEIVSGDANVFPFWTGLFDQKNMIRSSVDVLREKSLDKPLPLKYSVEKPKVSWHDIFASGYQFHNIWPMIGYPYMEVVSMIDKKLARKYLHNYSSAIEKYKNFLEVYNPDGTPFSRLFYVTDEGMLWASMHLYISEKLA